MLLLIQRLTQRPKKRSETEKEVGIKLQSPQSPSATQQGGRGGQPKRIGRRADTRPQDAANKTKRKA